ncbi:MAG: N-acetylmuramoyl-L-alanine amidase [Bacteroidota bacterium]
MIRTFPLVFAFVLLLWPADASAQLVADVIDVPVTFEPVAGKNSEAQFALQAMPKATEYTGIALQGTTRSDQLTGFARFDAGDWLPLYIVRSETGDGGFLAAYRSDAVRSTVRIELRFDLDAGATLDLIAAGTFDARHDGHEHTLRRGLANPSKTTGASRSVDPPVLNTRADWGARSFSGTPVPLARPSYDFMTFHHAAGFSASNLTDGIRQVKAIQTFHQNGRGWSDIGYHFVIDKAGNIFQGRPFLNAETPWEDGPALVQGAHAGGANTGNIGICLLGCYHPPEGSTCRDEISDAALQSYIDLFAFLSDRYGVDASRIRGHRDFGSTACPGDNNYALLPQLREDVAEVVRLGNAVLGRAIFVGTPGTAQAVRLRWAIIQNADIASIRIDRIDEAGRTAIFATADFTDTGEAVDRLVQATGPVEYEFIAISAAGREQVLGTAVVELDVPEQSTLATAYPNPFSEEATVRFYASEAGPVRVDVYDVTGRLVQNVFNAQVDAGTWHSANVSGADLPGGVYVVRMTAGSFRDDRLLTRIR